MDLNIIVIIGLVLDLAGVLLLLKISWRILKRGLSLSDFHEKTGQMPDEFYKKEEQMEFFRIDLFSGWIFNANHMKYFLGLDPLQKKTGKKSLTHLTAPFLNIHKYQSNLGENRMNLKRSTTSVVFAVMALSLISMTSVQQDVFAQTQGMSITATADRNSDVVTVTGKTVSKLTDVTFRVISPSGNNVVVIDQVSPKSDGTFDTTFKIGPTWKENGFYTISAKQSLQQNSIYTLDVEVEIVDGMAKKTSSTESSYSSDIFVPSEPNVAKDAGLEIHADAVIGSTTIEISGQTDRVSQDITFTVTSPNGNKVSIGQVSPMLNGEFSTTFNTNSPLWTEDGFYTVTAKQFDDPKYTASTEVEIEDGIVVPEFGTIAAMVLAVAIISIIAVSARSRLSIMPRI